MNEFYVERLANEKGEHVVHKGSCPSLPEKNKMQYIGVRSNSSEPLKEAANFWASRSTPCPECLAS
jgi:hypothetical protein